MADYGDVEGLDELLKALGGIGEVLDTGIRTILNDSADDVVDKTKKRTNVITGKLQKSWEHKEVKKENNNYTVEIGSDCDYAGYVEEGHKQQIGRYVPAIGKKLKAPFVNGKFMLRDSMTEEEKKLNNNIDEFLKGVFQDD